MLVEPLRACFCERVVCVTVQRGRRCSALCTTPSAGYGHGWRRTQPRWKTFRFGRLPGTRNASGRRGHRCQRPGQTDRDSRTTAEKRAGTTRQAVGQYLPSAPARFEINTGYAVRRKGKAVPILCDISFVRFASCKLLPKKCKYPLPKPPTPLHRMLIPPGRRRIRPDGRRGLNLFHGRRIHPRKPRHYSSLIIQENWGHAEL